MRWFPLLTALKLSLLLLGYHRRRDRMAVADCAPGVTGKPLFQQSLFELFNLFKKK